MIRVGDNIEKLMPYVPGKPVEELERELGIRNAVKLASNENPLGPSPRGIAFMKKQIKSLHFYPEGGCFYLVDRLARKLGLSPSQILMGNGSNEVLEIVGRTFYEPGDEIVFSQYAFIVYKLVAQALGAKYHEVPAKGLAHDLNAIAKAVNQRTKIVYLANPNNPTGTLFTAAEFDRFMKKIPASCVVVLDEAYSEYATDKDYPDGIEFMKRYPNLVIVRTFSKIYGLAGLRVGFAAADERLIGYMNRVREPFNVNTLAQYAALGALDDDAHLDAARKLNIAGMKYLARELGKLGMPFEPSHGNFVLVRTPMKGIDFYNKLLHHGVIVRPVGGYGLPDHVRVTVGTMDENRKFIAGCKKVVR